MFLVALRLGTTSFGGPTAHVGYFHEEYVRRRRWIDDARFAAYSAYCQILPGPTSSQLGLCVGFHRAGPWGALLAWLGFTLPSALLLLLAQRVLQTRELRGAPWVHGLEIAALSVVALAVWQMARGLLRTRQRVVIASGAFAATLLAQGSFAQTAILAGSALIGALACGAEPRLASGVSTRLGRGFVLGCFAVFGIGSALAILAAASIDAPLARAVAAFWRAGSLVFGGGHVILPLLEPELVGGGLLDRETFLSGYGLAQAVPGPLFTVAAYLGGAIDGWIGAVACTAAIFLPGSLLALGALPAWERLRALRGSAGVLAGLQAGVVGILAAALVHPLGTAALASWKDAVVASLLMAGMAFARLAAPVVVIIGLVAGFLL